MDLGVEALSNERGLRFSVDHTDEMESVQLMMSRNQRCPITLSQSHPPNTTTLGKKNTLLRLMPRPLPLLHALGQHFFLFFLSKASGQHDTEQDWGQHSLQSPERKYSPPNLPLIAFVRFRPRGFCGRDRTAAVQQGRKGKRLQRSMLVSEAFAAAAALMTHQMAPAKLPVVDKGVVTGTLLAGVGVYPPVRVCVCVPAAYKSHGP